MNLDQKKKILKNMKKSAKKRSLSGKFGWGDYHTRQQIKELEKEIRTEESKNKTNP